MKRILINACMVTKQPTGVAVHNIELLRKLYPKLIQQNIDFNIYCYDPQSLNFIENKNNIKSITLHFIPQLILKKFLSLHRLYWNLFCLKKISSNYDTILSLSTYGSLNSEKQIIFIHDLISLNFPYQHKFQYLYFKFLVPIILNNSKRLIAISDFTQREIYKFYNISDRQKIIVIKNGVDHVKDSSTLLSDKFVDEISNKNEYLLSIGASYSHKNIERLLVAMSKPTLRDEKIIIVGKPCSYYEHIKNRFSNNSGKNIIFLDYVNDEILSSLYKKAKLHIYLSLYEGFGFPPAEAKFYKTESLISKQPALEEIYGSLCEKAEPTDVNEIENKIIECLNSRSCTKSSIDLISLYNWNSTADKVLKLII